MSGFLDDISKVGGAAAGAVAGVAVGGPLGIPGAVAALGGAAAGASDPAQEAIKAAQKALETAAKVGADIAGGVADVIIVVAETAIEIVKGLVPGAIGIRPLRRHEAALADRVFKGTVQMHRIRIVSVYGFGARPFTIPGGMIGTLGWRVPAIGPLLAWTSIVTGLAGQYLIFMGDDGFRDAVNYQLGKVAEGTAKTYPGQTLIHELTHVWQGHHKLFAWSYVLGSLWNQCRHSVTGGSAYKYTPGQQWSQYNPEQQASIVEDWYVNTDGAFNIALDPARLPYIETNIRAGSIDAQASNLGMVTSGLTKIIDSRPAAPTMTQLLDVLDALRAQRTAYQHLMHTPQGMSQIAALDAEIARYTSLVAHMVSQGHLIDDRARFALNMGKGERLSGTAAVTRKRP